MSSFFGLAEKVLSAATAGGEDDEVRKTGGQEYNSPHHRQQPQGGFDTNEVLGHVDDEHKEAIAQAMQHVHNNSQHEELKEDDQQYSGMITSALSAISSSNGTDVASLVAGAMGGGGGNQLMGLVLNQVSKNLGGGGGEANQSMMNGVAMTMAKLVAQKQLSSFIGGSNSGGLNMLEMGENLLKSRFK